MLKCCGCQTNFILSLGGSFLSLRIFTDPQFNWGLVMPIRRTIKESAYVSVRALYNTHMKLVFTANHARWNTAAIAPPTKGETMKSHTWSQCFTTSEYSWSQCTSRIYRCTSQWNTGSSELIVKVAPMKRRTKNDVTWFVPESR